MNKTFTISLPEWIDGFLSSGPETFSTVEDRMRLAIDLAAENVTQKTGGPFGAAIFDMDSGQLVSVGVNCVVPQNCSIAHAEMAAIALAQQKLKTFDLSGKGNFELATSCEPCAMCLGAIPWSGVVSVLCGASEADARAVGFDEGAKPVHWQQALKKRGIALTEKILQEDARRVLQDYKDSGGAIYNPSGKG